jgi:uncharacterized protein YaeQ
MALSSTLYRFKLSVSDVDRGFYDTLDLRVAMHPSETEVFMLTRVIAYALNYEDGLEFTSGLQTPDEPAIRKLGEHGNIAKWIDIGNPAAKRLHKASKASDVVCVYTYKDPENLKREAAGENIHHADQIQIFAIEQKFLESLGTFLKRDNTWNLIYNESELIIGAGDESFTSTLARHSLLLSK